PLSTQHPALSTHRFLPLPRPHLCRVRGAPKSNPSVFHPSIGAMFQALSARRPPPRPLLWCVLWSSAQGWPSPRAHPMPPPPPAPLFTPHDPHLAVLPDDLACAPASLADTASNHGVTLEALALWMRRPDIRVRLHALETAAILAVRLAALTALAP